MYNNKFFACLLLNSVQIKALNVRIERGFLMLLVLVKPVYTSLQSGRTVIIIIEKRYAIFILILAFCCDLDIFIYAQLRNKFL
jgi:hypothetical protein